MTQPLFILNASKKMKPHLSRMKLTPPLFEKETLEMIKSLSLLKKDELQKMMHLSENQKDHVYTMYQQKEPINYFYSGVVFANIYIESFSNKEFEYFSRNTVILSALYGIVTPHSQMREYRLEMKEKHPSLRNVSLSSFWRERLTSYFSKYQPKREIIIDLSSEEYGAALSKASLLECGYSVIKVHFLQEKNGAIKKIAPLGKKARGSFLHYCCTHNVLCKEEIISFNSLGYSFCKKRSTNENIYFVTTL